jgi:uncharacterized protein (TIGR02271 family)
VRGRRSPTRPPCTNNPMSEILAVLMISKNGIRGKVITTSRLLDDRPEKSVILESGREVRVPSNLLHLRTDGTYYLDLNVDPRPPQAVTPATPLPEVAADAPDRPVELVIPVIHEKVQITKRTVETGRVRVHKTVSEETATVDEAIVHEEYEIRRVPMNKVVEATSPTRVDGDTTIIPVYEEETVTVTRLILREEMHLIKRRRVENRPRTIKLRKENVEVERIPAKRSS